MGWICGEDIDVSVDEENKKAAELQEEEEEEEPLEVQLGKGEAIITRVVYIVRGIGAIFDKSSLPLISLLSDLLRQTSDCEVGNTLPSIMRNDMTRHV